MSQKAFEIHHGILDRLVNLAPVSDDERRELHQTLADAAEEIQNPETEEDRQKRIKAEKDAKRAELQKQLDALK